MDADDLEGPEVDLLIRTLASKPKLVTPKPPAGQPAAAPSAPVPQATRAFGSLEALKSIGPTAPTAKPKKFVSAISVESLPSLPSASSFRSRRSFRSFLSLPSFVSLPSFPSLPSLPSLAAFPRLNDLFTPAQATVVRMCVGLSVSLAAAMPFWPYPRSGTWWMLLYLFAVSMVLVSGVWSAQLTWKTRLGYAHTIALAVVLWGITLATEETLRSGYFTAEASGLWR